MAAPSYVAASTGATDAGGVWAATCHAPGAAGRIIILQVLQDGGTSGAVALTAATNIENLAGTDNAWTPIGVDIVGGGIVHLWIGRSLSTSAPTASGTNSTSEDLYWRFYEFTDVSTGTTLATVIENATAGSYANASDLSATAADVDVTTLGSDRLALNFVHVNDDNAISVFTGQTGGAWVEIGEYAESSGTDGAIDLMVGHVGAVFNSPTWSTVEPIYGGSGTYEGLAQSFVPSSDLTVHGIRLVASTQGSPFFDNMIVEIQTNSGGAPSGTVVGTAGTLAGSAMPVAINPSIPASFAVSASLTSGTTYWIVARRSGSRDSSNYFKWARGSSDTYSNGVPSIKNSGTWTAGTNDFLFVVATVGTIGGGTASITDIDSWGVVGFALIGTTVDAPSIIHPRKVYPQQLLAH